MQSLLKIISVLLILSGTAWALRSLQTDTSISQKSTEGVAVSSEQYQLVPGSVYDGDTLRATDGNKEIKLRLCGIDAPEKDQALGIESRDHLRFLIAQGSGRLIVTATDVDQYDRTIAEVFVPVGDDEEEIHLNSQMLADGMAYVYPQYVSSCPNAQPMKIAERGAQEEKIGVWAEPVAEKPWDYRRR